MLYIIICVFLWIYLTRYIQISCTSSLSDDANRLNYFQLLPSGVRLYRVLQRIITEYNWRRVALIVQTNLRLELVSSVVHAYYILSIMYLLCMHVASLYSQLKRHIHRRFAHDCLMILVCNRYMCLTMFAGWPY